MQKTMHKLTTCLWFDSCAEDAMKFYASGSANAKLGPVSYYGEVGQEVHGRPPGSVMTATCTIDGHELMGLNGGPVFVLNPSISLYVSCKTASEVDSLYEKLSAGGMALMELNKYPFSDRYAWVKDKYGVSWQLILTDKTVQKISPALMFTNEHHGQAEAAIQFYTSVFGDSKVDYIVKYEQGEPAPGTVKHAGFKLEGQQFIAMDSPIEHAFSFNMATSFMVKCNSQADIDQMWEKLQAGGGAPSECGWLTDKFGVAWQVVPTVMDEMINTKDKAKKERYFDAMLKMKKLDIAELEKAFNGK